MAHTRSRRLILATALAAVVLMLSGCLSTGQNSVLSELNADRTPAGRTALKTHSQLNSKAQAWAEHLARTGRLEHSRLTDGVPSCWRKLGENVGHGSSVADVQDAYMRSEGHRKNVLATNWNWVGVGHATAGNRVYTVQVFMQGC